MRLRTPTACMIAALALAGCGGNSPSPAAVARYARAVNLRASDLPGMVQLGLGITLAAHPHAPPRRCASVFEFAPTMVVSPDFTYPRAGLPLEPGPVEVIHSHVLVAASASAARAAIAANHAAATRECLARSLENGQNQRGPLVHTTVRAAALPDPLPGTPSVALRLTFRTVYRQANPLTPRTGSTAIGSTREATAESFAFAEGPAIVALIDTHDPGRDPEAKEQQLIALLAGRARTTHL